MPAHEVKVDAVRAQVQALTGPAHVAKGGVHHFVPRAGDGRFGGRAIDVSALDAVLEVDVAARTCTAEPGATFADVVRRTLRDGLLPKVVPELEGITLGGAVAGCSVESMSHRYGGFHDTCLSYEVVGGDGERRELARGDELFEMIHGSYGTLAILTQLTFELVEAGPRVALTYHHHTAFAAFEADLRERCASGDFAFVDGIVHGPNHLVLCLGHFTDDASTPPSSYRGTEIYYRSTAALDADVMTTFDYCFRYDTECHWLSRTAPPLEWRPVRRAVGRWLLGSENLIRWSARVGPLVDRLLRRPDVVVDVFIPVARFAEFWTWYAEVFDFWPLWIVPYRVGEPYPWIDSAHAAGLADTLMIDCAVYGRRNTARDVDLSAAIEAKTYELGGIKTLISANHHTRERFWQIYNRPAWEAAKAQLDPGGAFRDLYDKFHGS